MCLIALVLDLFWNLSKPLNFFFMQTNRKKAAKKGIENSGFDSAENGNPGSKKARIQNHHRSATYAASMWHSAVQYVKPQNHSGIDL
jgi:hypothetical protein